MANVVNGVVRLCAGRLVWTLVSSGRDGRGSHGFPHVLAGQVPPTRTASERRLTTR